MTKVSDGDDVNSPLARLAVGLAVRPAVSFRLDSSSSTHLSALQGGKNSNERFRRGKRKSASLWGMNVKIECIYPDVSKPNPHIRLRQKRWWEETKYLKSRNLSHSLEEGGGGGDFREKDSIESRLSVKQKMCVTARA